MDRSGEFSAASRGEATAENPKGKNSRHGTAKRNHSSTVVANDSNLFPLPRGRKTLTVVITTSLPFCCRTLKNENGKGI